MGVESKPDFKSENWKNIEKKYNDGVTRGNPDLVYYRKGWNVSKYREVEDLILSAEAQY